MHIMYHYYIILLMDVSTKRKSLGQKNMTLVIHALTQQYIKVSFTSHIV